MDGERLASWERTRVHLLAASSSLPAEAPGVMWALEYLENNELGLALGELVRAGEEVQPPRFFWQTLGMAAAEMGLAADDRTYGLTVRSVQAHSAG